jgi:toxin ParE1/3/4
MKKKHFRIEVSDDAELDFEESFEFYFNKSPLIAKKFIEDIEKSFSKIKENPNIFPEEIKDIRKYVTEKFPFIIFYRIKEEKIQIIAIFHTSRNPEKWLQREN